MTLSAPGAEVVVEKAWWRQPEGRGSILKGRWKDYPVVHISWNDAKERGCKWPKLGSEAFCEWAGKRLPSEVRKQRSPRRVQAEWENAARGKRKELGPRPDACMRCTACEWQYSLAAGPCIPGTTRKGSGAENFSRGWPAGG